MSDVNSHATEDHLESYVMGRLPGIELEALEEHLFVCEGCQSRLDETENYVIAMKSVLSQAAKEPATMRDRLRSWVSDIQPAFTPAWAGSFALLAVVLGLSTQLPLLHKAPDKPAEPLLVRLEAMKGETDIPVADRPLALVLDSRGLPASSHYSLQIVDRNGKRVWEASATPGDSSLQAFVKKPLGAGQYFVRVYGLGQELGQEPLREYGLRIR